MICKIGLTWYRNGDLNAVAAAIRIWTVRSDCLDLFFGVP